MTIASAANAVTLDRLSRLADLPGAEIRRGQGWLAVRTGSSSNDGNVVISDPGSRLSRDDATDLVGWLADVPASWWFVSADERLARVLSALGASPERTGWWCRRRSTQAPDSARREAVQPLDSPASVEGFLDVLQASSWFDASERTARRAAMTAGPDLRHVVVTELERVVACGTAFAGVSTVEIVDLAVLPVARRRGFGRAIVLDLLRWAWDRDFSEVVAAPSPDGAKLFRAVGFEFQRVDPDLCFYLPSRSSSAVAD